MATSKNNTAKTSLVVLNDGESVGAPESLELLRNELKGLKVITETQYKTDGKVEGFSTSIQDETKVENLVRMLASLRGRETAYNNAQAELAEELGQSFAVPAFKVLGHSVDSFKSDIVLKIRVLNVSDRKKLLEELIKEGEQFISKQDLYNQYLKKVAATTGKSVAPALAASTTEG